MKSINFAVIFVICFAVISAKPQGYSTQPPNANDENYSKNGVELARNIVDGILSSIQRSLDGNPNTQDGARGVELANNIVKGVLQPIEPYAG